MRDKSDFDLDVINSMKGFPNDKNNCYIYIRGEINGKIVTSRIMIEGNSNCIEQSLMQCMVNDDDFAANVMNVVLNYVAQDKKKKKVFLEVLT